MSLENLNLPPIVLQQLFKHSLVGLKNDEKLSPGVKRNRFATLGNNEKEILILIPLALLIASCKGQNIAKEKVPSLVSNTLKSKFPTSNDVDWVKHGNIYEAELDINDSTELSVRIDESGKVLMQKQDIAVSELSAKIIIAIQNQYPSYTVDDVEKIEKDGSIFYQVELKGKGKKELNLVFSTDGKEEENITYWD